MAELSYEVLLRRGNCVLIDNKNANEYIVGVGYNPEAPVGQQWRQGHYFSYWPDGELRAVVLMSALDYLLIRTDKNYVTKARLEEIATSTLHELKETDEDSFTDFCDGDLDLTDEEKEWFGLGEEDEDDSDS